MFVVCAPCFSLATLADLDIKCPSESGDVIEDLSRDPWAVSPLSAQMRQPVPPPRRERPKSGYGSRRHYNVIRNAGTILAGEEFGGKMTMEEKPYGGNAAAKSVQETYAAAAQKPPQSGYPRGKYSQANRKYSGKLAAATYGISRVKRTFGKISAPKDGKSADEPITMRITEPERPLPRRTRSTLLLLVSRVLLPLVAIPFPVCALCSRFVLWFCPPINIGIPGLPVELL